VADKEREAEFLRVHAIVKSGYAGTLPNGNIVDRREHADATPIPENAMLGCPKPLEVKRSDDKR
jgi:hypothetical protein